MKVRKKHMVLSMPSIVMMVIGFALGITAYIVIPVTIFYITIILIITSDWAEPTVDKIEEKIFKLIGL